jgi:exopolyphosphatase/guanosine-5'-triphosphate,3'-diphosphate pyrophosphatase
MRVERRGGGRERRDDRVATKGRAVAKRGVATKRPRPRVVAAPQARGLATVAKTRPAKGGAGNRRSGAAAASEAVAAVDLGSNSFHMVVARFVQGQIHVIDRIREGVRLAAGLDVKRELDAASRARALECLQRFGQRLRGIAPERVRAVGTNTFRQARNIRPFLARAERALGHEIDVIPGREEARLVYLGVAHDLADDVGRRLVIDIGGGSTECIIGDHFDPLEANSLYMGCVGYSLRYFPNGRLRTSDFERAAIAARLEVQTIERRYRALGWRECKGSSGTAIHVATLLRENGWGRDGITVKGLRKLQKAMTSAGSLSRLSLRGLDPSRVAVLPGGVAILQALFDALGIERMTPASGALREGLLYDLLGRIRHEDVRDQTIRRWSERYHVDVEQAGRVERSALAFLRQTGDDWSLDVAAAQQLLGWAAQLHEVGLALAFTGYHKHSAYLVTHGDMPGFSIDEQRVLAALILGQRRKFPAEVLDALPPDRRELASRLSVLLRLSVTLNRSRSPLPLPRVTLRARARGLDVAFPKGWLDHHTLTRADLEEDAERLAQYGFALRVR